MTTVLKKLQELKPNFHPNSEHATKTGWALPADALKWLEDNIQPEWICVETGSGWTTCLLLSKVSQLVTIDTLGEKISKIGDWCKENFTGDRLENFNKCDWVYCPGPSYDFMPHIDDMLLGQINLLLIDGSHAYPHPAIDWFYGSQHLMRYGYVVLDDLKLKNISHLRKFLKAEPGWREVFVGKNTSVMQLINEFNPDRHHSVQPYEW